MTIPLKLEETAKIDVDLEGIRENTACQREEQIMAPIDTLPPEILCEIFLAYVDESIDGSPPILSSVSSKWREIAHGLANLWTRLTVSRPVTATVFFQRFDHHFGLSGDNAPLTLSIQREITYPADMGFHVLQTAFSRGKDYWSRIKVLDVNYDENYTSFLFENALNAHDLTLRTSGMDFDTLGFNFSSVRRLRVLLQLPRSSDRYDFHRDIYDRMGRYFKLDQMTELSLLDFPMAHEFWHHFMRTKCGSLQRASFTLDNTVWHSTPRHSRQAGIVPHLHTLTVVIANIWSPVFDELSFPALRNLTVMAYDDDYDRSKEERSFDDVGELIYDRWSSTVSSRRAVHELALGPGIVEDNIAYFTDIDAPLLEHLYIRDVEITDVHLVSLMRNLPNLRSLTARAVLTDFRPMVEALCDSVLNNGDFLPKITRIVLQDQYYPWVDEASFQRVLELRPLPSLVE